jgi:1,2-dihydroxy-3-keto-5-methylthiopentene dioxygenase
VVSYYDNLLGDQRLPHDYVPSRPVPPKELTKLGINHWFIPVGGHEAEVNAVAKNRDYTNRGIDDMSRESMGDVSLLS